MNSYCSKAQAIEINNKSILEKVDLKPKEFRLDKNFNKEVIEKEENKINSNTKVDNTKQKNGKWLLENGKWYYIDISGEKIKNRTYSIDGKTYIFGHDGAMIKDMGPILLGNADSYYGVASYYGNGDGTVKTSEWIYRNDDWFYYGEDGKAYENGAYEINGKVYLFNYQSTMVEWTGWTTVNGNKYYGNGDGTVKTSQWIFDDGEWYYVDSSGARFENMIRHINGSVYTFDIFGKMIKKYGWFKLENSYERYWLYGNGDGTVKTSQWILDNGKWYYVDKNGVWIKDKIKN